MFVQIAIGSGLMLLSILIAAITLVFVERVILRARPWLSREPHGPKLVLVLCIAATWIMALITAGVWVWALAFWALGVFVTLEASVYFSLVAFTTLGFGDILLPPQWRLLAGMAAANGLLHIGLLTALMVEVLRHIRTSQVETRRR